MTGRECNIHYTNKLSSRQAFEHMEERVHVLGCELCLCVDIASRCLGYGI